MSNHLGGSRLVPRWLLALTVIGLLGAFAGVAAAADLPPGGTFTDDDGITHEPLIEALVAAGLVNGCSQSGFCPARDLTRAELITVWIRGLGPADSPHPFRGYFSDVREGAWYAEPAERAFEMGLIGRYDGAQFRPGEVVTRAGIAVFLGQALGASTSTAVAGYFVDVPIDAWYAPHVERINELGITKGCRADPLSYCPSDPVTRAEMATMISRAFGLQPVYPPGVPTTTTSTTACPPG